MKQSAIAKRRAKHHQRFSGSAKLNLVSLMDIFTILVFFLIVNQSEVRVLDTSNNISLPVSIAEKLPDDNVLITVLNSSVLIQGRAVWQQEQALSANSFDVNVQNVNSQDNSQNNSQDSHQLLINAIKTELTYLANKRPQLTAIEQEQGRAVTIIGDASVPYQVLKQIMAACADTNYRNMSLAVQQLLKKTSQEGK